MPTYAHTQKGPLWWLVAAVVVASLLVGWVVEESGARLTLAAAAAGFTVLAATVATLTVRDAGDRLEVRFGPVPLWGTNVPYDSVRSWRRARSRFIDGWGIHWLPRRGWTFNLWGRDCVEMTTARRRLRVGTDDAEGLARLIAQRTGLPPG
jgi:hypothetical protein